MPLAGKAGRSLSALWTPQHLAGRPSTRLSFRHVQPLQRDQEPGGHTRDGEGDARPHRKPPDSPANMVLVGLSLGMEDANAQKGEPSPAIHGALDHLEPADLAFDGACGPWQVEGCLDSADVLAQLGDERSRPCLTVRALGTRQRKDEDT